MQTVRPNPYLPATKGTPLHQVHKPHELVAISRDLPVYGRPPQAIVTPSLWTSAPLAASS